jgi:GNAT superfamily N-acetyltransferase
VTAIIREAVSASDYRAFEELIREYVDWARERYVKHSWLIEMAFSYQSLDRELEMLSAAYGPPRGKTLLADVGGEIRGAVAYRDLGQGVCEMKRMFVPGRFHGQGLGRALCQALIAQAKADGFIQMRLDTGKLFAEAIGLYLSVGFERCEPYIDYPDRMQSMLVFMNRKLA